MDVNWFKSKCLPSHPKLYRIALALVNNKDDAEDILQEAYCKMWDRRHELKEIRNHEAFLVTLIKHLCIDHLRSPRANRQAAQLDEVQRASELSPEKEYEQMETVALVKDIISRLPDNQKQVIRLRFLSECSIEEIEAITHLSTVNIRTLIFRGRKIIREKLEKMRDYEQQRN